MKPQHKNDNTWAKMPCQSNKQAKRIKRLWEFFLHECLRFKVIHEACNKVDSIEDAFD
jgi:hypothetical protein